MRSAIDKLEADIDEYESSGQSKPSDETLRAILLAMVRENPEEHLESSIQCFDRTQEDARRGCEFFTAERMKGFGR